MSFHCKVRVAQSLPALYPLCVRGIYPIVDVGTLEARGHDPVAVAAAMASVSPCAIQLRAKSTDGRRMLELSRAIASIARQAKVPFWVNDRADVALLSGAEGVHVGQGDLPPAEVAALAARVGAPLRIGFSTHHDAQLEEALAHSLDYVALGPVASTSSKERPDPVLGVDQALSIARRAKGRRPDLPIVAIGGIGVELTRALASAFDAVAVIGAASPDRGEPAAVAADRVRELARAFEEGAR